MKKILSFFALTALCMGFVACEDGVEESNTVAPVNAQEATFDKADLSVAAPSSSTLDLQALSDANQDCPLTTVSASNVPEGYEVELVLQLSPDDTFTEIYSAETEIVDGTVTIEPEVLNDLYQNITKDPAVGTVYVRYAAYIVNGTAEVRVGDPDYYVGLGTLSLKPFTPGQVIESTYYLAVIENSAITDYIELTHSSSSQYDDPKFSTIVEITEDQAANGYQWIVVPESTKTAGSGLVYGTQEADYAESKGTLVEATLDQYYNGAVYEAGPYSFSFNMETLAYEVSSAVPCLYTPGSSNGWSPASSQILYTTDYVNYSGFAHLNGDFKFTTKPNWNGVNLGNSGEEGKLSSDGGAGNLNASTDGLYWLTVNYTELTYTMTYIETLGVIGSMNDWGAQINLTPSDDFLTWTGDVDLASGQEFKFRANDDWSVNLGGDATNLVSGGANLVTDNISGFDGDGTYTVTLVLTDQPYTMTLTKK